MTNSERKKIRVHCSAEGLKMAIMDALSEMDDNAEGFCYPIGEINGNPISIVWEPEEGSFKTTHFGGPLTYTAVTQLEDGDNE